MGSTSVYFLVIGRVFQKHIRTEQSISSIKTNLVKNSSGIGTAPFKILFSYLLGGILHSILLWGYRSDSGDVSKSVLFLYLAPQRDLLTFIQIIYVDGRLALFAPGPRHGPTVSLEVNVFRRRVEIWMEKQPILYLVQVLRFQVKNAIYVPTLPLLATKFVEFIRVGN